MNKKSFCKELGKMLEEAWDKPIDTDHPTCPKCGNKMNFYGHTGNGENPEEDFPLGEGYWECSNCGFKCTEAEVFPYME